MAKNNLGRLLKMHPRKQLVSYRWVFRRWKRRPWSEWHWSSVITLFNETTSSRLKALSLTWAATWTAQQRSGGSWTSHASFWRLEQKWVNEQSSSSRRIHFANFFWRIRNLPSWIDSISIPEHLELYYSLSLDSNFILVDWVELWNSLYQQILYHLRMSQLIHAVYHLRF